MQGWGWQVVYADVTGSPAAATARRLLERLRPAYVQVDLATRVDHGDPAAIEFLDEARAAGAQVMALGVDTSADLERALALGAAYGRGHLLGRALPTPRSP